MTSSPESGVKQLRLLFEAQDDVFARAFDVLREGIAQRAFPGAAVAITYDGNVLALRALGRFTYDPSSPEVRPECIWDLASLTKVVATTAAAMVLYEQGRLKLDQRLAEIVPEFARSVPADPRRTLVTLRMLLAHASGLPAYYRIFETAQTPQELLTACYATPLEADPGSRTVYSDIGFILLGEALVRLSGRSLAAFCGVHIFSPLAMSKTIFRPRAELRPRIPPTEKDPVHLGRVIQGLVNDENARVLGHEDGGHAGLFASALDVAKFAHCMLMGGAPILNRETIQLFTARQVSPAGTSRALGWDTPSKPSQAGKYFSPGSFGHLGFTGASLWCDPERRLSITLLTNRTWPDRGSELIKQVRPRFHDAVIECLGLT